MTVRFGEQEWNLMEMFRRESRLETIGEIQNILLFTGADEELFFLINSTLEKLWFISDTEFVRMNQERYKKGLKEEG